MPVRMGMMKCTAAITAILLLANFSRAQNPAPATAWPWVSPAPSANATPGSGVSVSTRDAGGQPPPRDIPLVEKKWEELSDHEVGKEGQKALAIKPERWKHAETENFIIHFRRVTEARKVVREIEFDLWFVAKTLGATPSQYRRKSHVFVFEDEYEWQAFLADTDNPQWFGSFAFHDELFLSVRRMEQGGLFDSHTLAHETTHAVVARLYPLEDWPTWLNEGFAEYMGGACVAARNHQLVKSYQQNLKSAEMPLDEMFALKRYPDDREKVAELYQTGEKFVRFLMNNLPKDRFRKFVKEVLATNDPKAAFIQVYGDKFKDFDSFEKKFAPFSK